MTRRVAAANGSTTKLAPVRERWHLKVMARRKKTPETSRITRTRTVAYARKQKPDGTTEEPDQSGTAEEAGLDSRFDVTDRSQRLSIPEEPPTAAATEPAAPKAAAPVPVPVPVPTAARPEADTGAMPLVSPVGQPPEMPAGPVPAGVSPRADAVEDPTNMPGPKEIPAGSPGDPAAAPGRVPAGDSRSLRRRDAMTYEFALIYRRGTFVITRFGLVGTRGQWRVVEYPTSAAASHAYAKESSRFVSDGFSDYRD
jgi:predicted DNA-binding WGR domain protein